MWHIAPELVRLEQLPQKVPAQFGCYDRYPQTGADLPPSGVLSSARGAEAANGGIIFNTVCDGLAAAAKKDFAV
jgi:creatinine amidohydrolase